MSDGDYQLNKYYGVFIEPIIQEGPKEPLTRIGRRITQYSIKEDGTDDYFPVPGELLDFAQMTKSKWKIVQDYIVRYKCAKNEEFASAAAAHDDYLEMRHHLQK